MTILLLLMILMMTLSLYTLHPLLIILSLSGSVMIISMLTFMMTKISLFSYMIILMILGGLIILFIYMASIIPNEPIKTKQMKLLIPCSIIMALIMNTQEANLPVSSTKSNEIIMLMNNTPLVTLAATYLFITLIAVVQITKIKSGPLRTQM